MQHSTLRRDSGAITGAHGDAAEDDASAGGRGGAGGSFRARTDSSHPAAVPEEAHHATTIKGGGHALSGGANTTGAGTPASSASLSGAAPQKPASRRASPKRSSRSTSTPTLSAAGTGGSGSLGTFGLAGPGEGSSPRILSGAHAHMAKPGTGTGAGSTVAWVDRSPSSSPSYLHSSLIRQPFAVNLPEPQPSILSSLFGLVPMRHGPPMRKSSSASSCAPFRRSSLFGPSSLSSAFPSMPSFQATCAPSSRKGRSRVCVLSIVSTVLLLFCSSLLLPFTFQTHRPSPPKEGSAWEPQNRIETRGQMHYKPSPPTPLFASDMASGRLLYGIIIDAGSTGTRIHVFPYRMPPPSASSEANGRTQHDAQEEDSGDAGPLRGPPLLPVFEPEHHTLKVRPGLSSYGHDPEAAGESLHPLLEFAKSKVRRDVWHATPIRLMATAGLRRMEPSVAQRLLAACSHRLHASGFYTAGSAAPPAALGEGGAQASSSPPSHIAAIIPGTWEGVYAWVSANYAAGTLGADPRDTVGIIEMGGASAQVTFVPPVPPPKAFAVDLAIPGMHCTLYSHSFLGLGQEAALSAAQAVLRKRTSALTRQGAEKDLWNPCEPIPLSAQTLRTRRNAATQAGTTGPQHARSLLLRNTESNLQDAGSGSQREGIPHRRGTQGHIRMGEGDTAGTERGRQHRGVGAQSSNERRLQAYNFPTVAASTGGNFSLCRKIAQLVIGAAEALEEGSPGNASSMAFSAGGAAGLAAAASLSRAPCPYTRCPVSGTFVPELTGAFLATENFHYTARFLRLRPSATLAEFAEAATAMCEKRSRRRPRRTAMGTHSTSSAGTADEEFEDAGVGPVELAKYCFAASYAVAFLHDGLGVSLHDTRLRFTNSVKGKTVDWALGALIIDILNSTGRPSPLLHQDALSATEADDEKDSAALDKASAHVSLWSLYNRAVTLVFAVCCFIAFALWSFNDFLRPTASAMYDVEKGRATSSSKSQAFRTF